MKTIQTLCLSVVLLVVTIPADAITNTMIAVSGTNLILSWPSYGYESYLIQYRQTLDPTDAWSNLTNAYPANGTNFTTYTLYGLVPPPATNSGGGSGNVTTPPMPEAMVAPADGSGAATPLAIYPPGFDLSGYKIYDPATKEWVSGKDYTANSTSRVQPSDGGVSPLDATNGSAVPTTGFFRVFHIPDWLVNLDGYTFDGPTFLPVDFSEPDAPTNDVDAITVLINGQPIDGVQYLPYDINGTTYWGVGIYFDFLPNGTNTIQLLTTVRQSDEISDQTPYMTFSNAPQTIVIDNTISFTNWSDLILSNTYTINAQSSITNVDWEIDIYDVNGDFVNYQTGHSDDGSISWTWDLTDINGNPRLDDNDPFFYPYITITQNSGDSRQGGVHPDAGSTNFTSFLSTGANQFPSVGGWLFTYMDNFYDDGTSNYAGADYYYTNAIHLMEGGPAEWGIPVYDYPIKYGRNYTQAQRDASWDSLKNYLQNWTIRNLYYFGHGAAYYIGADINRLDSSNNITGGVHLPNSRAFLDSYWVLGNLTVNKTYGSIPFRFIFLDGCDTAIDSWPIDWGVPKQTVNVDYYRSPANKAKARPNAFAGWDTEVGGNKSWGTLQTFWAFRQDWMGAWANENQRQLNDAFSEAFSNSRWVSSNRYGDLKVYGYTTMLFQQYNHAGDWP